jgi:hypothetical protein
LIYEDIFLQDKETRLAILNWLKDNDIKIFHLVRLNFLEALVSRKRMSLHNISHENISSISKNKVDVEGRVEISVHEIKEYCVRQTMYRNSIDLHFLNATTIHYETIFSDYNLVLKELQVEERAMDIKMKKLNRRNLRNSITNYDEVSNFNISEEL